MSPSNPLRPRITGGIGNNLMQLVSSSVNSSTFRNSKVWTVINEVIGKTSVGRWNNRAKSGKDLLRRREVSKVRGSSIVPIKAILLKLFIFLPQFLHVILRRSKMFLSRQRWLIPPRPLVTREYRPVLEREQLTDLRRRIKQNMSKWKEEEGTKATVKSKDDSGDRQEDKVLEKDLEKDRQKLDKAMKKEKRMQKVESLAEQVANYMPKLPFYVSNLVGRKPDVPDGTTFNNGGSEERETPFWKLHLGPASGAVSKSAVDERTRFCVANLRKSDPNNGEQCLRRLETFCGHLHKYPWAKGA